MIENKPMLVIKINEAPKLMHYTHNAARCANDEWNPLWPIFVCVVIVELSRVIYDALSFKCIVEKMDKIKEIRQNLQKELHAFHDSVSYDTKFRP